MASSFLFGRVKTLPYGELSIKTVCNPPAHGHFCSAARPKIVNAFVGEGLDPPEKSPERTDSHGRFAPSERHCILIAYRAIPPMSLRACFFRLAISQPAPASLLEGGGTALAVTEGVPFPTVGHSPSHAKGHDSPLREGAGNDPPFPTAAPDMREGQDPPEKESCGAEKTDRLKPVRFLFD